MLILVWLMLGKVSKLVMVIKTVDDDQVVERWQFDIIHQQPANTEQYLHALTVEYQLRAKRKFTVKSRPLFDRLQLL